MIGLGSTVGFAGALLLCLASFVSHGLPAVIDGLCLVVSMTGLLGANCIGLLMAHYPQNAGAVAALFTASQFGLGMLASAAVSYFHDPSGRSMVWVILVCTAISLAACLLLCRQQAALKSP